MQEESEPEKADETQEAAKPAEAAPQEPVEPREPEPVEPVEPTEPAEPTAPTDPGESTPPAGTPSEQLASAIADAEEAYTRGEQALADGDWTAYGEAQRDVADALRRANELLAQLDQ